MGQSSQPALTPARITQLGWGFAGPLILDSAIRHGIFDSLAEGPKTLEETATATGASLRGVRAIMNALVGLQLLAKDGERYNLTPESAAFLVKSSPRFMGGLLRHTSTQLIPMWMHLSEAVKEGVPPLKSNQEEFFHEFVADIFPMSYPVTQALGEILGLGHASAPVRVLDVAAGSGVWGIGLAQRSKQISVTAVDWPGVLDVTKKMVGRFGLTEQFTFLPGDMQMADFGTGYDIATLGHILHGEGATQSRALLKKTFAALAPGGTIAIQEFLVDEDRTSATMGLIFAVNMLVATKEGDTFTFGEIAGWLKEAGFENARTVDTPGPSPLILANRPK